MRRIILSLIAVLLASALLPGSASAKGTPDRVTVSGPGLDVPVEILNPDLSAALSLTRLEDVNAPLDAAPADLGAGYEVTRYYLRDTGVYDPFDRAIYYPDLQGGVGFVHYIGLIDAQGERDGWSEYDGHWFRAHAEADSLLRAVIAGEPLMLSASVTTDGSRFSRPVITYFPRLWSQQR